MTEIFPDIWFVTGTTKLPGPITFSRNMTVVRDAGRLILIGSLRLSDAALAELDELGKVTDVVRIAGFHGADDPFYKDRYGATVWVVKGQSYRRGFDYTKTDTPPYFTADREMTPGGELPLAGAKLYAFPTTPPEGLLILEREGGIVVSGDCLQNWATTDPYFSLLGKLMMKAMGFIKPHNIGPGWIKSAKPAAASLRGVLDLSFEHVLPVHGEPVKGGAKEKYRPMIEHVAATLK